MTCKHRGRARSRPGEAAAQIPRAIRGSHGGRGPWALPRWPRPTAAVPPQGEPVTIRDAGGRAPQNAVHVWSNIPAVRRYALALWAATRRAPAGAPACRGLAAQGRRPQTPARSGRGCRLHSGDLLPAVTPVPTRSSPRAFAGWEGPAPPRALGLPATPVRPGTRPQATHAHAHSLTCPWGAVAARTAHADHQAAGLRARPSEAPAHLCPWPPAPASRHLCGPSRRALSPLPSGWLAAPLRPRPARPCADSADPASATAGSCVFPAGSPCSPSQPLGPGIACGAAKAGRLPERRLLGRKPGWSAVGAACVVALPRAPATSSPPPGSQNPRAGPPGAHCRSHMLWRAQHPAETPPTAWPPLRPAGCPGLVPAGGPACFWHLVCGLRLPK